VSKASLYRRWPGKADLIVDAVYRTLPDADDARDTGSLRGDLVAVFGDAAVQLSGPAGAGMRGILSNALSDPAAADELRARRKGRGTAVLRVVIARAVARGEIVGDHVPTRVLEVGHAMLRHEFLFTGRVGGDFVETLVDDVMLPLLSPPAPPRAP
jgi:AcrR family transcriptional regulator